MPYGKILVDELENSNGAIVDLSNLAASDATQSASGYMSAADKTKLDGIEAGATADQTGAEIKAAYEGEADTNAFTDAEQTKLAGVEAGATADQTGAEIKAAYEAEADTNAFTDAEQTKLAGIAAGAEVNTVDSVAGKTGAVTLVKGDVGLSNVDNTSDANKPVSTAQQTALDGKADLVGGELDPSQLPDIAVSEYKGAVADQTAMLAISGEKGDWVIRNDDSKVYVITGTNPASASDWTALSYPAGFSGAYSDLTGKPTLGTAAATDSTAYATAAQGSTADSAVQPGDLATVATTGAYGDLSGTPTIPTNNNQLTNGAGYVTSSGNTIIGTDDDIDTSGATVIDTLTMTDGVITAHSTRTMTLGDLGYTGATNANYITNNNQLTNGAGYTTHAEPGIFSGGGTPTLASGVTGAEVRSLIGAGTSSFSGSYTDLSNKPTIPTNNNQLTNGAGYITSADGGDAATLDGINSPSFLRSDTTDSFTGSSLQFTDNKELQFGSGDDLSISSDGTDTNFDTRSGANINFYNAGTGRIFFGMANGDISCAGSITASGDVTAYSDVNLKENIEVIPNALEKVSEIRGVTYDRKDIEDTRQAGVIAQEVEAVLPEVVHTNEEGIKSVAYGNLVGLLIEAVKELKAEVETIKQERN